MKASHLKLGLLFAAASSLLHAGDSFLPTYAHKSSTVAEDQHPLAPQINRFLERDLSVDALGYGKEDYLSIINGQVTGMLKYQGDDGSIQNPLTGKDNNYATPHFAHCAAVLITSGYNTSPEIYEAAKRAMTYSVNKLQKGIHPLQIARRDGTITTKEFQKGVQKLREQNINAFGAGDFFPLPLMKAMPLFKAEAEAGRIDTELFAQWEEAVREIDPAKAYNWYQTPTSKRWASNWAVKNGTGEWLRENLGYSDRDYAKLVLLKHADNFTPYGMFREQAFCYDLFPRTAIVSILQKGYRGEFFPQLHEHMWRGAWTSLFVQSPNGELPPGFRSAAHIWNETMQVHLFESYASEYAKIGQMREAGIFKRAARLSFQSITEWIREDGTGYIVKNRYPIEKKHGYEAYSTHTNYNMLAMSQLATAWQVANESIKEQACPAELGGFVFDLESDHRNNTAIFPWTIANVGGNYLTIIRQRSNHGYDATGLVRVFLKGGNPRLGPAASIAHKFSGRGNYIAVGPTWETPDGNRVSLAQLLVKDSTFELVSESNEEVRFTITYPVSGTGKVVEHYKLDATGLSKIDTLEGTGLSNIGVQFPALVTDGVEDTKITINGNQVDLELHGLKNRFTVIDPEVELTQDSKQYVHVNGQAVRIYGESDGTSIYYKLTAE